MDSLVLEMISLLLAWVVPQYGVAVDGRQARSIQSSGPQGLRSLMHALSNNKRRQDVYD